MAQCRAALVPDGLFLAALLGGDTLQVGGRAGACVYVEHETEARQDDAGVCACACMCVCVC